MISGEELALWLRDVEAYEMALIIDSCQAAAAVDSLDFKPGPFGRGGFGQLAYDKQVKVLTATQADNRALEAQSEIKGGLLTIQRGEVSRALGVRVALRQRDPRHGSYPIDRWFGDQGGMDIHAIVLREFSLLREASWD